MNYRLIRTFALVAFLAPTFVGAQGGGRGAAVTAADSGKVFPLDRIVAVVGKKAITLFELNEAVNEQHESLMERTGKPYQGDTLVLMNQILSAMIDAELLKQKAADFKLTPPEAEISSTADDRMSRARSTFKTETEFRQAIKQAGFASPEALRAHFIKQERDQRLQRMAVDTLRRLGMMPTISVSEKDVEQAFDSLKKTLKERGPAVTFRQIVLKPIASDTANARAKALADSLRELINTGASWDSLAAKFSADSGSDSSSARRGGDLGWMRRGAAVERFDSMAFNIPVGTLSPVFKTEYGYHFLKVERARPGEVRARHILIISKVNEDDLKRAKLKVDSITAALKAGANYDSIADLHHEQLLYGRKPTNYPIGDLPEEYVAALRGLKVGDYSATFEVVDPRDPIHKAAVLQVLERNDSGEYTLAEVHQRLRNELQQAGSIKRAIDVLRKQTYVSVRLAKPSGASIKQ
jgi:peptidyl-prolyl cis-trans isomerase SurA